MSMDSTELEAVNDDELNASERMKIKLEKILSLKATVDEDVEWLEKEVQSLSTYLKTYSRIKCDVLGALHARRLRTRKLVTMSLAVSAYSLVLGLRSGHKDAMPWVTGLGAASLAISLFYLRDFLLSFRDPCSKWKAIEADVSYVPKLADFVEGTVKHADGSLDKSISEQIEGNLDRDELGIPQKKRSSSVSL